MNLLGSLTCKSLLPHAPVQERHCTALFGVCTAAKLGGHAAFSLLPGGIRRAGLLQELRPAEPCCQQSVRGRDGTDDATQLQVRAAAAPYRP
jgi:hypothetical protein